MGLPGLGSDSCTEDLLRTLVPRAALEAVRYALKADIRRYFPSIDHLLLKQCFRRVFKDPRLLSLMDVIVDRGKVPEPHLAWFPGDDLFTPVDRPKGSMVRSRSRA